jgi:hypothetical protein
MNVPLRSKAGTHAEHGVSRSRRPIPCDVEQTTGQWIEAVVVVVGPYTTSALVLAFGFARRPRRRHQRTTVNA